MAKFNIKKSLASRKNTTTTVRFRMVVEDVFKIEGRGIVVTGCVETGFVLWKETVVLQSSNNLTRECTVLGIEMFRKLIDEARAGDNVGLLLSDVTKEDIHKGDVLIKMI